MKQLRRILCVLLVCILTVSMLGGCSQKFAIKIGSKVITPAQYKTTAVSIKTQFLSSNSVDETDDLWDKYVDESYTSTMQEYLDAMVQTYLIEYSLYAIHFDELGLKLDDDTVNEIEDTLSQYQSQYGSKEKLEEALKAQGFSYDDFRNQYYDEAKKAAVIMHYFGPDSTENPVSNDELRAYYENYYTKVKHIFISTRDDESNELSDAEKEKLGEKANTIYDRVMAGEDFETLLNEYNEDPGMTTSPDGYVFSTEDETYTRVFYNAAFEMKVGEVRLVHSNLGYHIMKRYAFTDEEIFDPDVVVTLIENMMSEESSAILDELKDRIGVEYNNTVLTELSVANLPKVNQTDEDDDSVLTDELREQLGLDEDGNLIEDEEE